MTSIGLDFDTGFAPESRFDTPGKSIETYPASPKIPGKSIETYPASPEIPGKSIETYPASPEIPGVSIDLRTLAAKWQSEPARETRAQALIVRVGKESERARIGGTGEETTSHYWVLPGGIGEEEIVKILESSMAPDAAFDRMAAKALKHNEIDDYDIDVAMNVYVDDNYFGYGYAKPGGELHKVENKLAVGYNSENPDAISHPARREAVFFGKSDRSDLASATCRPDRGYLLPEGVTRADILEAICKDGDIEDNIRALGGDAIDIKRGEPIPGYDGNPHSINIFTDKDGEYGHDSCMRIGCDNSERNRIDAIRERFDEFGKGLENGRVFNEAQPHDAEPSAEHEDQDLAESRSRTAFEKLRDAAARLADSDGPDGPDDLDGP